MKKLIACLALSLLTSRVFAGTTWVETDKTEADILTTYKHRILHMTTSVFGPYGNYLLATIVTTEETFRCATKLPGTADDILIALSEGQSFCAMTKPPEKKKSKRKKKKRKNK